MLPILLGVGVAALFLSGCSDNQKNKESQGPAPSGSGGAGPNASAFVPLADASAPPPAPPPRYYVSFGNNLRAADIYQRLSEKKVSDEVLDRGCKTPGNLHVPFIQLAKDRRVEACEVYDFALDNYRQFPDVVETLTGSPIPWSLDDRRAPTALGASIRGQVQALVAKLQESPGLKKLEKGSEEYRKALGTALAFYVDFPNEYQALEYQRENLRKQTQVLVDLGLKDVQEDLFKNGGLNGLKIAESVGNEWVGNAIQSWSSGRGGPGARAKLLYAVLAEAEINPVFILATEKSNSDIFEEGTKGMPFLLNFGGRKSSYLQVGIALAETNPATGRPKLAPIQGLRQATNPEANLAAQELSLATFLAMDFHEQGDFYMLHSQGDPGISYKLAANILPTDSSIFNSIGVLLEKLGGHEQAEISYKEALRYDPTNGNAWYNMGLLHERLERHEVATNDFQAVAVWSPSLLAKRIEVIDPVVQKVLAKDPKNQDAAGLASKIKELREDKPDAQP
jgi:hypothetical protein